MTVRRTLLTLAALAFGLAPALPAQADLRAIAASGPTDIWVVGSAPAALHWDGQAWNEVPYGVGGSADMNGVWVGGPRDVFVVGDRGVILHFDGGSWSRMPASTDRDIVAVAGRTARDVYALVQSSNDKEAPQVLHYDGAAWTATALPMPFRANALALVGRDVLVAGFVYFDPQPSERRQAGVVARWTGSRWETAGWDGQKLADPVAGAAGWTGLSVSGTSVLLFGQREDGTTAIAMGGGAGWTLLPPAVSAMSRTRVTRVALAGDATPLALYDEGGFARFSGGRWAAVSGQAEMMRMYQPQPAATPQQQQEQQARLQQMMANPYLMAARMQAFDMSRANAIWGISANDFYVANGHGRVVHVVGDSPAIVYDVACADPSAGANPICQAMQQKQQ